VAKMLFAELVFARLFAQLDKTDTKYVKVLCDFPALPAVTACAHLQWDTRTQDIATIFSYAVPAFINEFQLRGFVDEEGFVRFALIVHGHHSPYLPVFRADGQWHHFCVTWQQENGTWAIYADGKRRASASGLCSVGPSAPQAILGHGTFIIGQDQDSLGGTFRAKESFSGNVTDLHIWQRVLGAQQIEKVQPTPAGHIPRFWDAELWRASQARHLQAHWPVGHGERQERRVKLQTGSCVQNKIQL
uniref:Pentraxin family member n=1 Tax=Malurus cyaneus samueli TaxID=2593467 RepID=A0A8C5UH88_9PASS